MIGKHQFSKNSPAFLYGSQKVHFCTECGWEANGSGIIREEDAYSLLRWALRPDAIQTTIIIFNQHKANQHGQKSWKGTNRITFLQWLLTLDGVSPSMLRENVHKFFKFDELLPQKTEAKSEKQIVSEYYGRAGLNRGVSQSVPTPQSSSAGRERVPPKPLVKPPSSEPTPKDSMAEEFEKTELPRSAARQIIYESLKPIRMNREADMVLRSIPTSNLSSIIQALSFYEIPKEKVMEVAKRVGIR